LLEGNRAKYNRVRCKLVRVSFPIISKWVKLDETTEIRSMEDTVDADDDEAELT